jgi:hypothetical protein
LKIIFFLVLFFSSFLFAQVVNVGNYNVDISQKNITVPILINSPNEFTGFQVNLNFDTMILSIDSIRTGEFVSVFNVLNNKGSGFVRIAGFSPNLSGLSGSGVIAYIDFSILSSGSSPLNISGKVSDKNGKAIPFSFLSGRIEVRGEQSQTKPEETNNQTQNKPKDEQKTSMSQISSGLFSSSFSSLNPYGNQSSQTDIPAISNASSNLSIVSKTPTSYTPSSVISYQPQTSYKPLPEDPSAKDNCILLIISEYGNPVPGNGFFTYRKGEKVECRVDKEVVLGNEKYLCVGFEGYGSIDDGKDNYISFTIDRDTKIKWKWEKQNGGEK